MSRTALRSSSPLRAGAIRGDEQEHNRIQLEHNLQHTDLSLHLSSQPASEQGHNYESSVEYPRHNSGPATERSFNAFASFDGDDFASHSHLHAWSYRTADDDDYGAIDPYGGTSMSTAAHHASALTLSAGLRGHGGGRRDISLSGAEYDPDRPLGDMIAGVDSRFSMFDVDPSSKSKYQGASAIAFDPLVVDDTAELDRVLESGRAATAASLVARLRSTAESSSGSDSDTSSRGNRPKLSDALQRVSTFSPKRPRSAPLNQHQGAGPSTTTYQRSHSSPPQAVNLDASQENDIPTPRPRSKRAVAHHQPEVNVQPPTPSSTGSQFTKMARGLAKSIEEEQRNTWSEAIKGGNPQAQSTVHERRGKSRAGPQPVQERNPFSDIGNALGSGARAAVGVRERKGTPRAPKVHLPDVTGLTSVVASPAKNGLGYYGYEAGDEPQAAEARFLSVLSAVQTKLAHLESENGISRRRVRELERELETCKAEVARERSRVLERESIIVQQREDVAAAKARRYKGKERSIRFEEDEELQERYKEVVEEKKALEALITTLRAHLSRLTSELSSHQELLAELRALRETDARTIREKGMEVERLRDEVERLAGEVEVLKEVVEDGLNERRAVREASTQVDQEVQDGDEEPEEESASINVRPHADRTMRTDRATLGASTNDGSPSSRPFIDGNELDRISLELEARRSDRSGGSAGSLERMGMNLSDDGDRSRAPSPSLMGRASPIPTEATRPHIARPTEHSMPEQSTRRASYGHSKAAKATEESPSTPFPQIRGGHLEKLFFSAPEHNAKTCNVCHRRSKRPQSPSWIPRQHRAVVEDAEDDEDEGFAEDPDAPRSTRDKGKRREHVTFSQDPRQWRRDGDREGLPPQTVLARVLRELEDDFTHYKGIYMELAEQYGLMDAASNVTKRNVLAEHLREVIDTLEQKGDQIASLYDLLSFKDKPISESIVPEKRQSRPNIAPQTSSWGRSHNLKRHPTFA